MSPPKPNPNLQLTYQKEILDSFPIYSYKSTVFL